MKWKYVAIASAMLIPAALAIVHGVLRASLPQLDGEISAAGLSAPVTIDRDSLGVPTISAKNLADLAYGTGFVHSQDRFFEMDLSRRMSAGELSELVGPVGLALDKSARPFLFRKIAAQVMRQAIIHAAGVGVDDRTLAGTGLASLKARPWEYWVLGSNPVPWHPEDTILTVDAMWWQLQYRGFNREIMRREVNERLGGALCGSQWKCALGFFYPPRTAWDAPAVGADTASAGLRAAAIPTPEVINIRDAPAARSAAHVSAPVESLGSNNWALAGGLTSTGAAIVANDMHLGQRVPIVWYRARLRIVATPGRNLDVTGVTLPGAPIVVAGSNGHIAWGFTNSYGNWLEVRLVPCTAVTDTQVQGPSGATPIALQWEQIRVHGAASVQLPVRSGPAGLLLEAHPDRGQCWFSSWLAQVPAATNLNLMQLQHVTSTREALALAATIGIPQQNAVVGDREGHIGWAIFGRIPLEAGPGRAAATTGWTDASSHPQLIDPPSGRLWSANARVTSDEGQEAAIGGDTASLGAEYDLGARAAQIRDDLLALKGPATAAAMLPIQLDERAVFLSRWHDLLLGLLDAAAVKNHPQRAALRQLVADWNGRASTDSVGYRVVRTWRDGLEVSVWNMILDGLHIPADGSFTPPMQFEQPLWQLIKEQPMHLLAARYSRWEDLLLGQVDATIMTLQKQCGDLAHCTWGRHNLVHIRHPLSPGLPDFLSSLLDMPEMELPGDIDMPRVQGLVAGASERFAVSPGHEAEGYFHMPGGQSGHPLSAYYRAGFMEWARGEPLPFLPGAVQHTLTLHPN